MGGAGLRPPSERPADEPDLGGVWERGFQEDFHPSPSPGSRRPHCLRKRHGVCRTPALLRESGISAGARQRGLPNLLPINTLSAWVRGAARWTFHIHMHCHNPLLWEAGTVCATAPGEGPQKASRSPRDCTARGSPPLTACVFSLE